VSGGNIGDTRKRCVHTACKQLIQNGTPHAKDNVANAGSGGGKQGHPNCPNVHEKPNRQTDRQLRSVEAGLGAAAPGPAGVPGVGW